MVRVKAHMRRRGYDFVGYACRWSMVATALAANAAQVVLFAYADRSRLAAAEEGPTAPIRPPTPPVAPSRELVAVGATQVMVRPVAEMRTLVGEETAAFVAGHREGYADGFVDCISMIRGRP